MESGMFMVDCEGRGSGEEEEEEESFQREESCNYKFDKIGGRQVRA